MERVQVVGAAPVSGRGERGAALIVMMVTVMVAASLSIALLLVASARHKSTEFRANMEAALAVAEAGLQRGMAEANLPANKFNSAWPPNIPGVTLTGTSAQLVDAENTAAVVGNYVVNIRSGRDDGKDNDGDGVVDDISPTPPNPDIQGEELFVLVTSTGYFGPATEANPWKVRVFGITKIDRNDFYVGGALSVGGANPTLNISNSNAFDVSGWDHDDESDTVYGPTDVNEFGTATPGMPAVSAAAPTVTTTPDTNAIAQAYADGNVSGPDDIATSQPTMNIAKMVSWAKANATYTTSGTLPGNFDYSNVIYHEGNQTITGNDKGAGIWIVNGDLDYAGTCQFKGIMIVTGKLKISGGGNEYLIRGAAIVGGDAALDFENNGTTDIRFSSEAITKAMQGNVFYQMKGWQQISTNP